jgi:hypothetical protein
MGGSLIPGRDDNSPTCEATGMNLHKRTTRPGSRLHQAYVGLMFAPERPDGSRTVPIARHGVFEVRLFEPRDRTACSAAPFWIEIYCHDTRSVLDSCRCDDLDDAEIAAERLVSCARALHRSHAESEVSSPSRTEPSSLLESSLSKWRSSAVVSRRN